VTANTVGGVLVGPTPYCPTIGCYVAIALWCDGVGLWHIGATLCSDSDCTHFNIPCQPPPPLTPNNIVCNPFYIEGYVLFPASPFVIITE
jgi:hypothetical protein